jgi:hypothetical protein
MDDLRRRFESLGRRPVPDLWPEITSRAALGVGTTGVRGRSRLGAAPASGGRSVAPILAAVVLLAGALVAAAIATGAVRLDPRQLGFPRGPAPSVLPATVGPSTGPTPVPGASQSAAPTASRAPQASGIGSGPACPSAAPAGSARSTRIPLADNPFDVLEVDCRAWIQVSGAHGLVRVDPATDEIDATVPDREISGYMDVADGAIWGVAGSNDPGKGLNRLVRLDPGTLATQTIASLPDPPVLVAVDGDVAWVQDVLHGGAWIVGIGSNASSDLPYLPGLGSIDAAFGTIWSVERSTSGFALVRRNPQDGTDVSKTHLGQAATCVETPRGFACVAPNGTTIGITSSASAPWTDTVDWTTSIPGLAADGAFIADLGDSVWVMPVRDGLGRTDANELIEIDVATGAIRRRIPYAVREPNGLWGATGSLWVEGAGKEIIRVDLPAGG